MTLDDGTGTFDIMLFGKNAEIYADIEKKMNENYGCKQ